MILSHLLTINPRPFDSGGFGEVYRGTLNGSPVCVKRLRVAPEEDLAVATQVRFQHRHSPYAWSRINFKDVLQRSCNVEGVETPEYPTTPGCYRFSTPARVCPYACWEPAEIYRTKSGCESNWTCRCRSGYTFYDRSILTPVTSYLRLRRASATCTPVT